MILQDFKNTDIEGDDFEGIDATINIKNLGKMFSVVSKQMYRRPINSIVRELVSNCFDSHIEAKVDDPVVVVIKHDEGGDYITFKDVGVGMSPERMIVYSEWFSSTKEATNDQIGMWGLGSKSPLAYTSSFFLTTVFEGQKYEYCIHEGVKKPRIDLLIKDESSDRNGTEVKIYIKNISDVSSFVQACKSELTYFDNVFVDSYYDFDNNYTILEYETFKFRVGTKYSNQLHLIIGLVPYPISWDELGIDPINIPCGIKFKIGDLQVTPERESLRYIDLVYEDGSIKSTKQIILARIEEFKKELLAIHEKQTDYLFEDYEDYLNYEKQEKCYVNLDGNTLDISSIAKKVKGIFTPLSEFKGKLPENLFLDYRLTIKYCLGHKGKLINQIIDNKDLRSDFIITPPKSGKINNKKLQYLHELAKETTGSSTFYTVIYAPDRTPREKLKKLELSRTSSKYDYSETNITKQYKLLKNYIKSEFNRLTWDCDSIHVPEEWLKAYNLAHKEKLKKEDNSFLVYDYGGYLLAEKKYVTEQTLQKFTGFIIYGYDVNEELLRNFKELLSYSKYGWRDGRIQDKQCRLYKVAPRNQKYFSKLKNAVYIEDFMGNNKIFKRFATAALIEGESKAVHLKGYESKPGNDFVYAMEQIFPPVADAIRDIESACNDYGNASYTRVDNKLAEGFHEELIEVAKEHNLYDKDMIEVHQKLERYVDGLDLVKYLAIKNGVIPHLVDFLVLKGKKVDPVWTNPDEYEVELIKDSLNKANYLKSIFSDSEYLHHGSRYSNGKTYLYSKGRPEKTVCQRKELECDNLSRVYISILKYQNYGKTESN